MHRWGRRRMAAAVTGAAFVGGAALAFDGHPALLIAALVGAAFWWGPVVPGWARSRRPRAQADRRSVRRGLTLRAMGEILVGLACIPAYPLGWREDPVSARAVHGESFRHDPIFQFWFVAFSLLGVVAVIHGIVELIRARKS